jgi:predicted TIM-barrel fold metal-dependent hydrolase
LRSAGVAAAAVTGGVSFCEASGAVEPGLRKASSLIDTNVWLSQWPFRRLPLDDTRALVAKLRSQGVTEAWAGTFEGILHKNLGSANARLARECQQHGRGLLVPFGTVNPQLPNWEEELRRCHEDHRMRGIRLHPNYHSYKLDQPVFGKLLELVEKRGLILQIALSMEDERMQHPLLQVPHADASPLLEALKDRPRLKIVLLNWFRAMKGDLIGKLAKARQVYFEIATVEGVNGVGNLINQVQPDRVLFGSYAPFFYFESAALKLKESVMTERELGLIERESANRILQGPGSL